MRRIRPDLTYKASTKDLMDQHFDAWQLPRKDPREGLHRIVNRLVSFREELDREKEYVEAMFFPDRMNLGEAHLLYRPWPARSAGDLRSDGIPLSGIVRTVSAVDELIDGVFDSLVFVEEYEGHSLLGAEKIVAQSLDRVYLYHDMVLTEVNLLGRSLVSSGEVDHTAYDYTELYFDVNRSEIPLREKLKVDSVEFRALSGDDELAYGDILSGIVPEVQSREEFSGIWNPAFDVDGDGMIGVRELTLLHEAYGRGISDFDPETWARYAWADLDDDGYIGESDYNAVASAIPSVAPDITAVVSVPEGVACAGVLVFEKDEPRVVTMHRSGNGYELILDDSALYQEGSRITKDSHTGIYFGIFEETKIKAYRYEESLNMITGDNLVHVPRWSNSCQIVDLDVHEGYLFALVTDGTEHRLLYGDIWTEAVPVLDESALVSFPSGFTPDSMSCSRDGYFLFSDGSRLLLYRPQIDACLDLDGCAYMNLSRELTDADGNAVTLIPHMVFNSFDSFAYSLGIDRPWGCDNLAMKRLIYDFFKYEQGNSRRGMVYGITRELGFENIPLVLSGMGYPLPAPLDPGEEISINGYPITTSGLTEERYLLSGDQGTFEMEGLVLFPSSGIQALCSEIIIEGTFLDGNGDGRAVRVVLDEIEQGYLSGMLDVFTLAETDYLEAQGLLSGGVPTDALISMVESRETEYSLIFANARTNEVPMDMARILEEPVVPTVYDPDLSGILTDEATVTL